MRKRRTRGHVIADLSANYVEKQTLLCGYSVERMVHDYGVDLQLYTYSDAGEVENDTVKIQLKATENLPLLSDGQTISMPVERADLDFWLGEWSPVILIVYDAQEDTAYWVHLQAYFAQVSGFDLRLVGETVNVHLSKQHVVNPDAIRQFSLLKTRILQQFSGVRHDIF